MVSLDKTLIHRLVSFKALRSCTETLIWTLNRLVPNEVHLYGENPGMFSSNFFSTEEGKTRKDILDDMGVSKLSTKAFLKVNYSFKREVLQQCQICVFFEHSSMQTCLVEPKNKFKTKKNKKPRTLLLFQYIIEL